MNPVPCPRSPEASDHRFLFGESPRVLGQDFMADSEPLEQNGGSHDNGHPCAEPSILEAANAMRWVFNHPEEARWLAERGRLSHRQSRRLSDGKLARLIEVSDHLFMIREVVASTASQRRLGPDNSGTRPAHTMIRSG